MKVLSSTKTLLRTFQRTTNQLVHLFIGKDTIHTTPEHPFYVPQEEQIYASANNNIINRAEKGAWVAAKNLKKGAKVFLFSTLLATVDSSYTQDTLCTVYNFEVEHTHNYFVGKERVLVHNTCIKEVEEALKQNPEYWGDAMRGRYQEFIDDINADKIIIDKAKRIGVVKEMKDIRVKLFQGKSVDQFGNSIKLSNKQIENLQKSSISFGEFSYVKNGQTKTVKFITLSGKKNPFIGNNIKKIDDYEVIVHDPAANLSDLNIASWITNDARKFDAEAKVFEAIAKEMQLKHGIDITKGVVPPNINLKISLTSEMKACNSCDNIIQKFNTLNSSKKVDFRYGTNYVDLIDP